MRTVDLKFAELCSEIDYWKSEAERYKAMYEEEIAINTAQTKKGIADNMNMVGQILKIALNSEQTENGFLIKNKDSFTDEH